MNLRKILFFTLPLLVLGSGIGFAQQTKKVVGGPELGSQIKNFTLVDQKGKKKN